MSISVEDIDQAYGEARVLIRRVDRQADIMAKLLAGRLRSSNISQWTLSELKRELEAWNLKTQRWRK